jgi:hypothetical protein
MFKMHLSDHRFPPDAGPRDDDRVYIQEWRNLAKVARRLRHCQGQLVPADG